MSELDEMVPEREIGIDPSEYEKVVPPFPADKYRVIKRAGVRQKGAFEYDGKHHVWAAFSVQVADGPYTGRYADHTVNTMRMMDRKATKADDLLISLGYAPYPRTANDYLDALEACEGAMDVVITWEATCLNKEEHDNGKQVTIRGAKKFDEKYQAECPKCGAILLARNAVQRIIV